MSSTPFDDIVTRESKRTGVDYNLVRAIIRAESNWDPNATRNEPQINDKSYGLMQVLHGTAAWMGFTGPPSKLYDPEVNIHYGVKYLAYLKGLFPNDVARQVAAYNAGPGNSKRRADDTFFNQSYVDRVERFYKDYRNETHGEGENVTVMRSGSPMVGPVPYSPPMRFEAERAPNGAITGTMETFLTPENTPWLVVGGFLTILALMGRK